MSRLVSCVTLAIAVLAVAAAAAEPAAPPPVVAVDTAGPPTLRPVDPRTLQPLPHSWSRAVGWPALIARSPGGSAVVVSWPSGTAVFDARTGRRLAQFEPYGVDTTLYWLGAESRRLADLILVEDPVCFSGGCGVEFRPIGSINAPLDAEVSVETALPSGLVGLYAADQPERVAGVFVYPAELGVPLRGMPASPTVVVGDPARDRVFVVSSGGVVARVDRIGGKPRVTYHHVELDGLPFEAAWAGGDRIALWGANGLGTIDVRTWRTSPIAAGIAHALPTPHGIVGWGAGGGVTVYRPHGALRFRALADKRVRSVVALGRYAYVRADHRYTVDLESGRVVGRAREKVLPAEPSYVRIP